MFVLFTDYGHNGPYLGQLKAVLWGGAPHLPVVDLFADAPIWNARASTFLLAHYSREFPRGCVFVAVVDPGVGGARECVVVEADGRFFVGPDNGLMHAVVTLGEEVRAWRITWRPTRLSATFHGRDIFAPVAVQLARGDLTALSPIDPASLCAEGWGREHAEVVYVDHFGNLISGIAADAHPPDTTLAVHGEPLARVRTFADVAVGAPLCYENSCGLLEVAINQGSARDYFSARVGTPLSLTPLIGA